MFPGQSLRVLVADDAAPTRERLRAWLAEVGIEATACAARRDSIFGCIEALEPGCVVVALPPHDHEGLPLLSDLRARCPECMVIVMTNDLSDEWRRRCAAMKIQHCLDKVRDFERVVELVRVWGGRS